MDVSLGVAQEEIKLIKDLFGNMKNIKPRTEAQNRSLHLYFSHIAEALNAESYDVRIVLQVIAEKGVDMMWSSSLVKELLWRSIQKKYTGKKSTTELDAVKEITDIHDMLNKFLSENFYVSVPFPSMETLIETNEKSNNR